MACKSNFKNGAITAFLTDWEAGCEEVVASDLADIGLAAVNEARSGHGYTDRSGNLTSSIGFAVSTPGGGVTLSDFGKVAGPKGGEITGDAKGRGLAAALHAQGGGALRLAVVAGMQYARDVERRGYNVLSSAERVAADLGRDYFGAEPQKSGGSPL